MCFNMRVAFQSNKNISYWDLVSPAHKKHSVPEWSCDMSFFKVCKNVAKTFVWKKVDEA